MDLGLSQPCPDVLATLDSIPVSRFVPGVYTKYEVPRRVTASPPPIEQSKSFHHTSTDEDEDADEETGSVSLSRSVTAPAQKTGEPEEEEEKVDGPTDEEKPLPNASETPHEDPSEKTKEEEKVVEKLKE